jgi:hypothetical protein
VKRYKKMLQESLLQGLKKLAGNKKKIHLIHIGRQRHQRCICHWGEQELYAS